MYIVRWRIYSSNNLMNSMKISEGQHKARTKSRHSFLMKTFGDWWVFQHESCYVIDVSYQIRPQLQKRSHLGLDSLRLVTSIVGYDPTWDRGIVLFNPQELKRYFWKFCPKIRSQRGNFFCNLHALWFWLLTYKFGRSQSHQSP